MSNPLVSVILPTLNRSELLRVAARSVLAQSCSDLELIIVDDGSQEDIGLLACSLDDSRVQVVRREHTGGPAAARNTGIEVARGRYIAFQDSDDQWVLDKLRIQLEEIQKQEAVVICSVARCIGAHVHQYRPSLSKSERTLSIFDIANSRAAYTQSWLVPAWMLSEVGGFDENLPVWEDYELLLRLAKRYTVRALPETLAISFQSEDSVTKNRPLFANALQTILRKHEDKLRGNSDTWALLNYSCGRMLIGTGELLSGRRYLLKAIKAKPVQHKYLAMLVASYLGTRLLEQYLSRFMQAE